MERNVREREMEWASERERITVGATERAGEAKNSVVWEREREREQMRSETEMDVCSSPPKKYEAKQQRRKQ